MECGAWEHGEAPKLSGLGTEAPRHRGTVNQAAGPNMAATHSSEAAGALRRCARLVAGGCSPGGTS